MGAPMLNQPQPVLGAAPPRRARPSSIRVEAATTPVECSFGLPLSYDGVECPPEHRIYAFAENGSDVRASLEEAKFNLCVVEHEDENGVKFFAVETANGADGRLPFAPATTLNASDDVVVVFTAEGCGQATNVVQLAIERPVAVIAVDSSTLPIGETEHMIEKTVEYNGEDVEVARITARTGYTDSRLGFVYPDDLTVHGVTFRKTATGKTLVIEKKNGFAGVEAFSVYVVDNAGYCKQVELKFSLDYHVH